jgi:uncharacterized membrane protein YfcA
METLLLFVLAGFVASLINGSLGMGYGALTATGLLLMGIPPASASAAVHFSQVGTAFASGVAHWRFRNIDWRTVGILAIPGAVGAAIGAYVLVKLNEFSIDTARVWIGAILLLLGLYVLIRFAFLKLGKLVAEKRPSARFFGPLGLSAGFVNATSGGGWGPMATSTLLSSGRLEPRKIIGSVSAACSSGSVSGTRTSRRAGTFQRCWSEPGASMPTKRNRWQTWLCPRRQAAHSPHQSSGRTVTWSPACHPSTSPPMASMVPDISCPMGHGEVTRASIAPCAIFRSVPQIPVKATAMRTSSGPGSTAS